MRLGSALVPFLVATLAAPGTAGDRTPPKSRPRLDVRANPSAAFSPVNVVVVAKLVGGDELEDFYCPGIEWEWGDGTRSAYEADCPPFQQGMEMTRRFSATHAYRESGDFSLRVTLRRADRPVAAAATQVSIHAPSASAGF